MDIKVVNKSKFPLPQYKTQGSSGVDLMANIEEPISLKAHETKVIPTGLFLEIPEGVEGQVRPRSGLAANHSMTVLNTPGTIDSDYRGEVKIILHYAPANPNEVFVINPGDRIAQLVFTWVARVDFVEVEFLGSTERADGGLGHTGIKQ